MSEERQKNQEQLAFSFAGGSEAPLGGSEQESVRPPCFIGFSGFGADGLSRSHSAGSEPSPMFTDLSAGPCRDRHRQRESPVFVCADDRRGPTPRGAHA